MAKREFVMLAHVYNVDRHNINGWFWSEKLDGQRVFYDGGITRGLFCDEVPWANIEKDSRYLLRPKASGLWTRYGKAVQAPDWFLDRLPNIPLDGELWAGRGNYQTTRSIVADLNPNSDDWKKIKFVVFDSPLYEEMFADGIINNPNYYKSITRQIYEWAWFRARKCNVHMLDTNGQANFETIYYKLLRQSFWYENLILHEQHTLDFATDQAKMQVDQYLDMVQKAGGEGVILRKRESLWTPERSHNMLKVKPWLDSEAVVIGYVWGRKTDKGSKLLGKMGALMVQWGDKVFELSGFTDAERLLTYICSGNNASAIGELNAGKRIDTTTIMSPHFPIGSKVTFKYRELTDSGIPKESRYWRKYNG